MTTRPADDPGATREVDAQTMRRLLLHEARVHAIPGRTLRDLGDAILLHDPADAGAVLEPARGAPLAGRARRLRPAADRDARAVRVARPPAARLAVAAPRCARRPRRPASSPTAFATWARAGSWSSSIRLRPSGVGRRVDERRGDRRAPGRPVGRGRRAPPPRAIVEVLLDAFDVEAERQAGIEAETAASLRHPWFTHYLVRHDGRPAAVARRATFDGLSYLSSIGTAGWARGRGLGRPGDRAWPAPTALAAGSDYVYLGVFADNPVRSGSTSAPGSSGSASWCPDLRPDLMAGSAGESLRATLAALAADAPPAPASRLHALGWATVELDRAERELSADARSWPRTPSSRRPIRGVLGARCRVALDTFPGGVALVLLEPATEGRLSATLARHGEGAAGGLVRAGPARTRQRRDGTAVGEPRPGPFGPERHRLGGAITRPAPAPRRCRAGYHPRMTDQATITAPPAEAARRRGDRRAVHRRGLPGRPERHRRPARALRLARCRGSSSPSTTARCSASSPSTPCPASSTTTGSSGSSRSSSTPARASAASGGR